MGEVHLAPLIKSTPRCTWTTCHAPKLDPASNRGTAFIRYAALKTSGVYSREASIRGNTVLRLVPIFNGCLFSRGCLYTRSPCLQLKWVLIFIGCLFCMGAYYPESTVTILNG